jgi:glycerol-3-phosphate dehydrogenase
MEYDVIVIGGGINGCGIARDAAMRGLSAVLIEKDDFGSGTTGASSQMIHGGARYLLSDVKTTKLSSQDSGYIQKIAPHLLFRIPFIVPVLKKSKRPTWGEKIYFEATDAYFQLYDRYSVLKNGMPHTRLNLEEALAVEPDLNGERMMGAFTFDEWGVDVFRLCIHNVLSAQQHGCKVFNHNRVAEIIKQGNRVVGVRTQDTLNGMQREFRGKIVVNATGPWTPRLAAMAGCTVKLRPGKGVHVGLDRRISNYAILAKAIDGRDIFVMPYQNVSFVGTTDDDFFGDPDDIPILEDEVEYLLEGIEQVFPRIREARVTHAWAGVRPTLYERGPTEDDLSRDYKIFDHEATESTPGFLSLAGGKLASYRLMSEHLVDAVVKKLGKGSPCQTHFAPLPGAERRVHAEDLAKQFHVPLFAANRLVYRYGGRAYEILEMTRSETSLRNVMCQCDPVLEAELRYVIRNEWARSLEDLKRRTRLSLGPCQGTRCFMMAAQVLGEELSWKSDQVYHEVKRSMELRWKEKLPVMDGIGLQQEELMAHIYCNVGNLDRE